MLQLQTVLAIVCATSIVLLFYIVKRTQETFSPMAEGGHQEFIYIPPQRNMSFDFGGEKSCDTMHDLTSLGSLPPTILEGGITVQTMGPLGPMHLGGDPNPYANLYLNSMNVFR